MSNAPDGLERFVKAQERTYDSALAELKSGRKQSHWMWFVLPQLKGLGHSRMATLYGIADLREAVAYLAHPVLGPRLVECVHAMLRHASSDAEAILGTVDALKFRSCLTLFSQAAGAQSLFASALQAFYGGRPDPATLRILHSTGGRCAPTA